MTDPREQAAGTGTYATLMMARTRALSELQLACAPRLRAMLEQTIADLDRQLAALSKP